MFCCGPTSVRDEEVEVPPTRLSHGFLKAGSTSSVPHELQVMLDKMKGDILAEIRSELREISAAIRDSNQHVVSDLDHLASDVLDVQRDLDIVRAKVDRGAAGRWFGRCAAGVCGGEDPAVAAADARRRSKDLSRARSGAGADAADGVGKEPKLVGSASLAPSSSFGAQDAGGAQAAARPAATRGALWPVVERFESAVGPAGAAGSVAEVQRDPFVDGLQAYAGLLDKMGGSMGSYLETNIKKLKNSKADRTKPGYRDWLLSELPVHQASGYREYVDESAWMANLWLGWTLEFFVEFFAQLREGKETKPSADVAYEKTLSHHHNFFQRNAFKAAVGRLPRREDILVALQGSASTSDAEQELAAFVAVGRPLVAFCLKTNEMLSNRLQEERKVYLRK